MGYIEKEDFKTLKEHLGTGGSYHASKVDLRGRVLSKGNLAQLLNLMGYVLCS